MAIRISVIEDTPLGVDNVGVGVVVPKQVQVAVIDGIYTGSGADFFDDLQDTPVAKVANGFVVANASGTQLVYNSPTLTEGAGIGLSSRNVIESPTISVKYKDGITLDGTDNSLKIDTSYVVPAARQIIAGNGLTQDYSNLQQDITFNIDAGNGLNFAGNKLQVNAGAAIKYDNGFAVTVDISGVNETSTINTSDVFLVETSNGLRRLTKGNLFAGFSGSMQIRGTVNPKSTDTQPITTLTVSGDPKNATITQGTAPTYEGISPNGYVYIIKLDAGDINAGVDISMEGASGSPVLIHVFDQDQLVWTGDRFTHLPTGDNVLSVFGRFGNVVAQNGDYNASQISINPPITGITATNVADALAEHQGDINALDASLDDKQDLVENVTELNLAKNVIANIFYSPNTNEYIEIPTLDFSNGDTVELSFFGKPNIDGCFFGSDTNSRSVWAVSGVLYKSSTVGDVLLDGVPIVSGTTPCPTDGTHKLTSTIVSGSINSINGAGTSGSYPINTPVFDVKITSVNGNRNYPIDDGWSKNPVILDTLNPNTELLANGDFATGNLTGWTESNATATVTNQVCYVDTLTDAYGGINSNTFSIKPSTQYKISLDANVSAGLVNLVVRNQANANLLITRLPSGDNTTTMMFTTGASDTDAYVSLQGDFSIVAVWNFDNVSVTEWTSGTAHNFVESNWKSTATPKLIMHNGRPIGEFVANIDGNMDITAYSGSISITDPLSQSPQGTQAASLTRKDYVDGVSKNVPDGGSTNQVLAKVSDADGDVTWVNQSGGGSVPDGGTTGQALRKKSNANGDADWENVNEVIAGGVTGQVLAKASSTDYDLVWVNQSGGGGGGVMPNFNVRSTNFTASNQSGYLCDVTNRGLQVTLPANPQQGDYTAVGDYNGNCSVINPIVIAPSGADNIHGDSEELVLTTPNVTVWLSYINGVEGWRVVDGIGEDAGSTTPYEEVIIVPWRDAGTTGQITLPDGYQWSDFEYIEFSGGTADADNTSYNTTQVPKEQIAASPTGWKTQNRFGDANTTIATAITANNATQATISGNVCVWMKGYTKYKPVLNRGYTTLYDGVLVGTSGVITLSESINNFDDIRIYARTTSVSCGSRNYQPEDLLNPDSDYFWVIDFRDNIYVQVHNVTETTVTVSTPDSTSGIYKVVGINY